MKRKTYLSGILRGMALIAVTLILVGMAAACGRKEPTAADRELGRPDAPAATQEVASVERLEPSSASPTATPSPTPVSGTITVWHSWAQRDGDALEAILADLFQQYPSLRVDTLFVAQNDLLQSYAQAAADGNGPDVILAPNWWLNDLRTLGVIRPLDEGLKADAAANLWPAAVENVSMDGQLFGVPTDYESVALYFNKALVQEDALPETLDDLFQAAQASPQLGIGIYANPFHVSWGFPAFGSDIFDESGHAVFDQGAGAARFLQWLADVDALEGSYVDSDYGMLVDRFKRGEFAFLVDGPWAVADLRGALGDNLGVTALPLGPNGPSQPWLYANAAYINPAIDPGQNELAEVLIEHLTSAHSGEQLASIAGRLPANRTSDLAGNPMLMGFANQAATSVAMPQGPHMDAFWRYGGDMILRALAGAEEMQSIVSEAATLVNDSTGK